MDHSIERPSQQNVDFHALFGLSGGFAARKKGMHFGARVWISMPFLDCFFNVSFCNVFPNKN